MENKTVEIQKKKLFIKLTPLQQEYLEAIDWLFNGGVATGRTSLICVVALLNLLNGGYESYVIDHHPISHSGVLNYNKAMVLGLASEIGLEIEVVEVRNGLIIRRVPEYYKLERKNVKKP